MIDYAEFDAAIGLNWYEVDPDLQDTIARLVPADLRDTAHERMTEMGALAGGPIAERAEVTDRHPPRLERFDRWGHDTGHVVHHPGALATKRDLHAFSHAGPPVPSAVFGSACSYLLNQSETGMGCAVGMTGGVAGLVEGFGSDAVKDSLLPHLRADDYDEYWDGAMFLTERDGGSDLGSATKTSATHVDGDLWVLNGFKWFCSNVDADVIATLARPDGAPDGTAGIALFAVPRRRRDGSLNGIRINRLKDKLGTRAVPTGEVDFVDAEAYLLAGGERSRDAAADGKGLGRMMSGMVQGSRLGVAYMGLGIARRSFLEAAIYAAHRRAFRNRIDAFPMVRETLVDMVVDLEAASALSFEATHTREREEWSLWRIAPTLAKFRATRVGIETASAAIEVHGGNGYIEDWPVARQLRDAQCHTIWEGTENIIAIDVMRAIERDGALGTVRERVERALSAATQPVLSPMADEIRTFMDEVDEAVSYVAGAPKDVARLHPRRIAHYLSDAYSAALLVEQAAWELEHRSSARKAAVARRYVSTRVAPRRLRGMGADDRLVLDAFDSLTRYQPLEADQLMALTA